MHVFVALVIGLVLGGILGYAFRGKEHAALQQVGADVAKTAADVQKKV